MTDLFPGITYYLTEVGPTGWRKQSPVISFLQASAVTVIEFQKAYFKILKSKKNVNEKFALLLENVRYEAPEELL